MITITTIMTNINNTNTTYINNNSTKFYIHIYIYIHSCSLLSDCYQYATYILPSQDIMQHIFQHNKMVYLMHFAVGLNRHNME